MTQNIPEWLVHKATKFCTKKKKKCYQIDNTRFKMLTLTYRLQLILSVIWAFEMNGVVMPEKKKWGELLRPSIKVTQLLACGFEQTAPRGLGVSSPHASHWPTKPFTHHITFVRTQLIFFFVVGFGARWRGRVKSPHWTHVSSTTSHIIVSNGWILDSIKGAYQRVWISRRYFFC